jgi:hypothetical protein
LLLVASVPARGAAQLFAEAQVGVLFGSSLVRDSIVQDLAVGPQPAPTLALRVGSELTNIYAVALSLRWARSDLVRRELDQTMVILPLTVWSASVAVRRHLTPWASVEASVGGIKYAPSAEARTGTIFQDDAPLVPAAGVAARIEHRLGSRWHVGLETAYDFHRFNTQALRATGVGQHRSVHRVAATVIVRRTLTDATR